MTEDIGGLYRPLLVQDLSSLEGKIRKFALHARALFVSNDWATSHRGRGRCEQPKYFRRHFPLVPQRQTSFSQEVGRCQTPSKDYAVQINCTTPYLFVSNNWAACHCDQGQQRQQHISFSFFSPLQMPWRERLFFFSFFRSNLKTSIPPLPRDFRSRVQGVSSGLTGCGEERRSTGTHVQTRASSPTIEEGKHCDISFQMFPPLEQE